MKKSTVYSFFLALMSLACIGLIVYGLTPHPVKTPEVKENFSVSAKTQKPTGPQENKVKIYPKPQVDKNSGTTENAETSKKPVQEVSMTAKDMDVNHLFIPAAGAYAYINNEGSMGSVVNKSLVLPHAHEVTRWVDGAVPGAAKGNTVISGHVSWNNYRGALFHLAELTPGNMAYVRDSAGKTHSYKLISLESIDKSLLPKKVWEQDGPHQLVVITCGGQLIQSNGYQYYHNNIIATFAEVE